ncbi:glycosyltransferase family 4 protein [Chryseolinea lacunae]|uniref:Glycosyltransferase family 4 protein n=1 Tax=Chryseolinea lacunae TaxID=2801331 RepID=A0ABS1KSK6_9BACT|nr:glycosyltransferase family 1 protein [Chryseolinea lacunae]MBL0742458.1 glycosyltransferase family 4 protein [Chryseolinea lacunae]
MGKQRTIGLIYSVNENWIAGTYYVENLICSLKALPENDQPFIVIYTYQESDYQKMLSATGYKNSRPEYIRDVSNLFARLINAFSYRIFNTHWVTGGLHRDVDVVFPNPVIYQFDRFKGKLFWIPDFQEKHFPRFFSAQQLADRKTSVDVLVKKNLPIVFSSEHARRDFQELYPQATNAVFVMPFAVTLPDLSKTLFSDLKVKYALPEKYFVCSNQFWAHKNHAVVLKALAWLKKQGVSAHVLFTGKPFDNRNPEYYPGLQSLAEQEDISSQVSFLGFIPREDQLVLMQHSLAIVQPSLFEGWSTVVEDAKALNHNVIVSDIPVHREQLPDHPFFFLPDDAVALGTHMKNFIDRGPVPLSIDYRRNVQEFGKRFMRIAGSLAKG